MREILFRGKRLDNGEWVTGGYAESLCPCASCIVQTHNEGFGLSGYECIEVIAATVGQYTGLQDKNGKRIFEGDILSAKVRRKRRINPDDNLFGERVEYLPGKKETAWSVEWKDFNIESGFMVYGKDRRFHKSLTNNTIINCECCVIGNIYDNPELMEGGEQDGAA